MGTRLTTRLTLLPCLCVFKNWINNFLFHTKAKTFTDVNFIYDNHDVIHSERYRFLSHKLPLLPNISCILSSGEAGTILLHIIIWTDVCVCVCLKKEGRNHMDKLVHLMIISIWQQRFVIRDSGSYILWLSLLLVCSFSHLHCLKN
jgi:hypothetical protein